LKKHLVPAIKLALAVGLIWWLIAVNVTTTDVAVGELSRTGGEPVVSSSLEVLEVLVESGTGIDEEQPVLRVRPTGTKGEGFVLVSSRKGHVEAIDIEVGDTLASDTFAMTLASGIPFSELGRLRESWPWFLAAQIPFGIVLLFAAWRWQILLHAQGIDYSFRETHSLVLIGNFFNQVMLGSTGGDVVKAYYVAVESPDRRAVGVLTVFLDRVIGLLVLGLIAGIAVFANLDLVLDEENVALLTLAIGLWCGLGAAVVSATLFFSARVRSLGFVQAISRRLPLQGLLKKLSDAVYLYKSHPRAMMRVLTISVGIHLLVVVTNLCLLRCLLPVMPSALPFFLLVPLAQIIMAVPLTPASLGTAETAYDKLFALVGVRVGALVSILQRMTYYFWSIFGAVAYLRRKATVRRALEASHEAEESGESSFEDEGAEKPAGERTEAESSLQTG